MRKLFAAFLALCLLMQVSAGMAMQVNMVFAAKVSNTLQAHSTQAMPPCHTDGAQIVSQDSSTVQHHHCSQCCVPALIPTVPTFTSYPPYTLRPLRRCSTACQPLRSAPLNHRLFKQSL
jgi:hypothetical protein